MEKNSGQTLIELTLAIGLAAIFLPTILTGAVSSIDGKAQQYQREGASQLLTEANEAVRVVREKGWTTFAINGTYRPVISNGTWSLATGTETVNAYNRQIVISNVYRDTNGIISPSGGSVDPSTKRVDVTISWYTPLPSSLTSTVYLSRFLSSSTISETSQSDFNQGTLTNTTLTNTSGGEVTLGLGGQGLWCDPNLSITALDLPKNGAANAISAIDGKAFAGTGDNASGVSYASVAISNTNPPTASVTSTFDGYKTNGIFGETDYAYVSTDNNSKEVVIIDIAHVPYSLSGYFNAPGNGSGKGIFVKGQIGFMTAGNTLYTFDLSSKLNSRPELGSITLAGTGNKIYVVGNYVYVAVESTTTQLQIIQASSDGKTLSIVGQASVSGGNGRDIYVDETGTYAYLATETSATQPELYIFDVTTKTGNHTVTGSYDTNGMNPKGITVVTGNKAIIVGIEGEEYQVVDITDRAAPSGCGGLNIDSGINGVASILEADGDAYSYIITRDATAEFKMIEGGPGGQYATNGTYESKTFDAESSVSFNRVDMNVTAPSQTTIKFQIAIADAISSSCSGVSFTFVGPDGTDSSFYTGGSPILLDDDSTGYENPGQCLRYKAYLSTSDQSSAPSLKDITFNYSR